jgi:replicative DNA helicase
MVLDNAIIPMVAAKVKPGDFYIQGNSALYQGICSSYDINKSVDLILLKDTLGSTLDLIGGVSRLAELVDTVPSVANWIGYMQTVLDKSRLRQALAAGEQIISLARSGAPLDDIYKEADAIKGRCNPQTVILFEDCLKETISSVSKTAEEGVDLFMGWQDVDEAIGGLRRKSLYIIGGKTSQGKTSVCVNIVRNNLSSNAGCRILYNGFENLDQFATRLAAVEYGVPLGHFLKPDGNNTEQLSVVKEALSGLSKWNANIRVMNSSSIAQMRAVADEFKPDIVFLDYIQRYLHRYAPESDGRVSYQAAKLASDLQDFAIDRNCAVLAFSQLSRRSEEQRNRKPSINDLKESGDLENTADVIGLLYWPWRDSLDPSKHRPEDYYFLVAKNKLGECGEHLLRLRVDTLRLEDRVTKIAYPAPIVGHGYNVSETP